MYIYQTYRPENMDDGGRRDKPDLAFLNEQDAINYINDQPGICGRRADWTKDAYPHWTIKQVEVLDRPYNPEKEGYTYKMKRYHEHGEYFN